MTKKIILNLTISLILAALIVWAISCAVNPVTGKRELMLITQDDELALGKQTDQDVISTYGIYDHQNLQNYANELGQKMSRVSHRPNLKWEFKVLDTPVINAFAVPGGYVYLTRGILTYLNSEAELAGVVGHEIGHVSARHTAKAYSKSMLAQLGLGIGGMLSETVRKYGGVAEFGVGLLFLKFSRDNEREADRLGIEYSSKTGYDALHMANFFETLERLYPESSASGLPDWFSTHPNPPDRIVAIQNDAKKWQASLQKSQYIVNHDEFLHKIDGMIYGDDPRQGYAENNMFYHPQMKFQFPVPASWQLNNTPSQVQMFTAQQDAVIVFSLAKESSPESAADAFINSSQATVKARQSVRVNGFNAYSVNSEITSEQQTISLISYFIQMDNNIFAFHGYTSQAQFASYLSILKSPMEGFKRLTDPNKINVKPASLVIRKTSGTQTLRQALQQFGVAADKLEDISILNGKKLEDQLPANTLLKIVQK